MAGFPIIKKNVFFLVGIILVISFTKCTTTPKREIQERLKAGDLVFRKGKSIKSSAVLQADQQGIYSHIGIIAFIDSTYMVIHTAPGEKTKEDSIDKVKLERVEDFFSTERAHTGAIMRFKDSTEISAMAAKYAYEYYKKKIPFDNNYNLDDTTQMYCTELVWHCYLSAGRDISLGKRNTIKNFPLYSGIYIFPSDIYTHDNLITIYNF